jgi:spoIIIJ-associated protein
MQKIKGRIIRIFDFYGIEEDEIEFEESKNEDKVYLNVVLPEDRAKHFIGAKGETLEALEILVRLAHQDEIEENERLLIDINGYRKERENRLQEKALDIAEKVRESGQEYVFNDLNSYERFLVHSAIGESEDFSDIETFSEDDTFGRVLVIRKKED